MLQSTFIQKLSSKSLRKSYKTQERYYLISVNHIQIHSTKETKIIEWKTSPRLWTMCSGSSEFPVFPSWHCRSTAWWALTSQATEQAWIHWRLPNPQCALPNSQMLPRKSFPLALPWGSLAQFLFQDEETGWWHSGASVSTGPAEQSGQTNIQGI